MDGGFGNNVGIEAVTEVDGINVITVADCWSALSTDPTVQEDMDGIFATWGRNAKLQRHKRGMDSPFQVAVHDREEDLKEQIDRVYQDCQQVQPCFAGHHWFPQPVRQILAHR